MGFSPGSPVSSTNKTDCQDITEILLKVALNTINQISHLKSLNRKKPMTIQVLSMFLGGLM